MRRSALKIKADNSYDPLATKLYKKSKEIMWSSLAEKIRKNTFRNIRHMAHLLRISGSFVNHLL